jgi:hypothetical protein
MTERRRSEGTLGTNSLAKSLKISQIVVVWIGGLGHRYGDVELWLA